MALDLATLSLQALRERFTGGAEPVTPHVLRRLQRDPRRGVRQLYETLKRRLDAERSVRLHHDALLHFERVLWRSGLTRIAGVDEVGVGPLAGPVVAAAVVFPPDTQIAGVDDSKKLDAATRCRLDGEIRARASAVAIGMADVREIDSLNIYQAGLLAMRRAVELLPSRPEHVLVDARQIPGLSMPQNPFNKGDGINFSIAAASIVAKVHRDALMEDLHRDYPQYGFARHKGYSTPEHQAAIRRHGPCPLHRQSFTFLRELCGAYSGLFYELQGRLNGIQDARGLATFEKDLELQRSALGDPEHRKLRLCVTRRWKALAGAARPSTAPVAAG